MDDGWSVASDGLLWPDFTMIIKGKSKPTTNHPWKSRLTESMLNHFWPTKPTLTNLTKKNHKNAHEKKTIKWKLLPFPIDVHMLILQQHVSGDSCVDGWNKVPMNSWESFTHCANISQPFSDALWLSNARFYTLRCWRLLCFCDRWRSKGGEPRFYSQLWLWGRNGNFLRNLKLKNV